MSDVAIDPCRLKTIRRARKIGRPKLAKLSGVSERQVAKIECGDAASMPEGLLQRFSDALQVPVPVLTGDFPIDISDLGTASVPKCTSGCCG